MSHYSVLVIGPAPDSQLAPYDENLEVAFNDKTEQIQTQYETEGTKYIKFADGRLVNIYDRSIRDLWKPVNKDDPLSKCELELPEGATIEMVPFKQIYADFDTFATEYHGFKKNEQSRYGYMYNPNAKWDWYKLGGRWENELPLKNGTHANETLWSNIDIEKLRIPFAILKHGKWYEKGKMGWWAMVSNEKSQNVWDKEVKQLIADIAPDTPVYIYDCHI